MSTTDTCVIAIDADGTVVAYTGKCELGQGLYTVQTQLVAEELSVPIERVRLIQCDTAVTPDQGTTSGAQSHPTNFNQANLALAAATARHTLVRLASARLGAPADELAAGGQAMETTAPIGVEDLAARVKTARGLLEQHGLAVVVESEHSCLRLRGARKEDTSMVTTAFRGALQDDRALRAEVLGLMDVGR